MPCCPARASGTARGARSVRRRMALRRSSSKSSIASARRLASASCPPTSPRRSPTSPRRRALAKARATSSTSTGALAQPTHGSSRSALMRSIYDFPEIYDAVLQRPPEVIEAEVASIRRLLADRGITKGRILELACGTCPHGIRLARQGFSVTGIDRSRQMLDAARQRAALAGVELDLIEGDIVDFSLDTALFDCAIFMSETF